MSARSMTGFARVRKPIPDGEIVFSLKSVNHRGLDLHFHMSSDLDEYEPELRAVLKSHINRGSVQVQVQVSQAGSAPASFNRDLLAAWVESFRAAAKEFGLAAEPDLNAALRQPGMMQAAPTSTSSRLGPQLLEAAVEAVHELNAFRDREGAAIAMDVQQRRTHIEEIAARIEAIRSQATAIFHKRLHERLRELLNGSGIDPQRLAHEAALLADRSDISEEILRLKTHALQLAALVDTPGEKGKKLDFLLQEMNREANTILSKTGGLGDLGLTITDLALAAKSEVDKIREQSLNLE